MDDKQMDDKQNHTQAVTPSGPSTLQEHSTLNPAAKASQLQQSHEQLAHTVETATSAAVRSSSAAAAATETITITTDITVSSFETTTSMQQLPPGATSLVTNVDATVTAAATANAVAVTLMLFVGNEHRRRHCRRHRHSRRCHLNTPR